MEKMKVINNFNHWMNFLLEDKQNVLSEEETKKIIQKYIVNFFKESFFIKNALNKKEEKKESDEVEKIAVEELKKFNLNIQEMSKEGIIWGHNMASIEENYEYIISYIVNKIKNEKKKKEEGNKKVEIIFNLQMDVTNGKNKKRRIIYLEIK